VTQAAAAGTYDERHAAHGRWRSALSGFLAVAVMLGVSELLAALVPGARSHVVAVGDQVIDHTPGWVERAVIANLGTSDKPFLIANVLVVSGLLGAGLGLLAARRFVLGAAGIAVMAGVGTAASFADPQTTGAAPLWVGIVSAAAGIATLWLLLRPEPEPDSAVRDPAAGGIVDRRRFLGLAGAAVLVAGVAAVGGRLLTSSANVDAIRRAIRLPRPFRRAPVPPPGASLAVPGLSPLFVPNGDFYRIDTALTVPQVDPAGWSLQVKGRVDRPLSFTYAELMAMPQIEADVTLACVSNPVGGELVGNARWQGVPLYTLLERAGVQNEGTQIIGRSVDGFTAGFPTRHAIEDETAMVAVAMNGVPLPARHGFPARLLVPGLYGYVSATKWLSSIELWRLDEFNGYWIPRGWSKSGPIKTESRIDVPNHSPIAAGPQTIAGVAWAPTRGIERVEVQIDGGPWQNATLAAALGVDTWRQWLLRWHATPGEHTIAVRATDGTGYTQTSERSDPPPDGATGYHTIRVDVR
jgi:DMSO/TMAO reductase YedYZ molybdopterin-dependent catalytic subunit